MLKCWDGVREKEGDVRVAASLNFAFKPCSRAKLYVLGTWGL